VVLSNGSLPGAFQPKYTYNDAFDLIDEGAGKVMVALACGEQQISSFERQKSELGGRSISQAMDDGRWCMSSTVYNRGGDKSDMGTPAATNDPCPKEQ